MLKLNSELRSEARVALSGKWVMAAVVTLVYILISGAVSAIPCIGFVTMLFVAMPLVYGLAIIFYDLLREGKEIEIGNLFDGFKDYKRICFTFILVYVYTFLWSLLLVIPGIIKQYSYALTPYILKDEPDLKYNAAIERSMQMMHGNKMKLFLLDLSFIGWAILSVITLGIGFFFLMPYMYSARAAFYEDLKGELMGGHNWEMGPDKYFK